MHKFPFVTVDVFSSRALEGNPVAVFTDARGLSDADMQAIALETGLSETTFIIPRDEATERADGVMMRIFTVAEELPFAGHPTLGTASVVAHARHVTEVALDLKVGRIPISFKAAPDGLFGEMTQRDPEFGKIHDANEIARATVRFGGMKRSTDRSTRPIVGDFCDSIARWRLSLFTGQIQLEIRMAISRLVCRLYYRAESQDRCLVEPF
jgi:trans-2,3-dihydro-3-hydroxyanthranilate isomerase